MSACAAVAVCCAAHNRLGNIAGRAAPPGQPRVKAFNIFNALGSIAFAYNFTGVLMEIQVGRVHTVNTAANSLLCTKQIPLYPGGARVHFKTQVQGWDPSMS